MTGGDRDDAGGGLRRFDAIFLWMCVPILGLLCAAAAVMILF